MTIRNGQATFGGGIFNGGGQVALSNDVITANRAVGAPGGGDGDGAASSTRQVLLASPTRHSERMRRGAAPAVRDWPDTPQTAPLGGTGVNGAAATGGNGGNGGSGGAALGGAIYNAAGASLTLSGAEIAADLATGGVGGNGGAGGSANGGNGGAAPAVSGSAAGTGGFAYGRCRRGWRIPAGGPRGAGFTTSAP